MSMVRTIYKGSTARVIGEFVGSNTPLGDPVTGPFLEPSTVTFKFKTPAGATTTYVFGTNSQLVRDGIGQYHVDIDANQVGVFYYQWTSTGAYQGAIEGSFEVPASQF